MLWLTLHASHFNASAIVLVLGHSVLGSESVASRSLELLFVLL